MFNKLFASMKNITTFSAFVSELDDVLSRFTENYLKDGDSKDAAIDAVIEILQAHKTTVLPPK